MGVAAELQQQAGQHHRFADASRTDHKGVADVVVMEVEPEGGGAGGGGPDQGGALRREEGGAVVAQAGLHAGRGQEVGEVAGGDDRATEAGVAVAAEGAAQGF